MNRFGFSTSGRRGASVGEAAPPPPDTLYQWYAGFDMTLYPPHTAAGDWGPQNIIVPPPAPSVSTSVNVATFAELSSACATGARTITLTASINGTGSVIAADIDDVDIIVPSGIVLQRLFFGNNGQTSGRIRIRGSALGDRSTAGQCHEINFSGSWVSVIIDSVNWTGSGGNNVQAIGNYQTLDNLAVVNSMFQCGGEGWLGSAKNMLWVGNTMNIGTLEAGAPSAPEPQWIIRNSGGGWHIYYKNFIKNRYFHPLRVHPATSLANLDPPEDIVRCWIDSNIIINTIEAKALIVDDAFGGSEGTAYATWFTNNRVYTAGGGTIVNIQDSIYNRVQNNTFYSIAATSDSNISIGGDSTDAVVSGNAYETYTADPAWTDTFAGVGADPTGLDITP